MHAKAVACSLIWSVCLIYHVVSERPPPSAEHNDVLVLTVASNETDGYKRFIRSVQVYGFGDNLKVLGMGHPWKGGNVKTTIGGGYKINLLKDALKKYEHETDKVVLFTDSYDVIYLSGLADIVARFESTGARVLFSAEEYCWPDRSLASLHPSVSRGKRFLNSGGFIGYASDIYALLRHSSIADDEDDQLFYTKIYLDEKLREKHKIKLDHRSEIFQNLYGAVADIELRFKGNEAYLQNTAYNTAPLVLHGNGFSKLVLNALGNYLAHAWAPDDGCISCWENTIELNITEPETFPTILIAIFIERPTPFLEEFFHGIYQQIYPKSKVHIFIHNNVEYHEGVVTEFLENAGKKYRSVKRILPSDGMSEAQARTLAIDYCLTKNCSGYFSIDSVAHIDNEYTLKLLVEQQRGIVAPLLIRPYKAWSNFWGAMRDDGFYARSFDYMEIIKDERRGLWNVPFIINCYLINATLISNKDTRPVYSAPDLDPDMAFARANRNRHIFMYVSNRLQFGHLINPDTYDIKLSNPNLYQLMDNKLDWEKRYLHENYTESFSPNYEAIQPCPDVYWFPIVSRKFTKALIEVVESFGKWSDGSNTDPRLAGGYENVPTRDIHMNQVDFEPHWLYFLKEYVRPLQELVYTGYYHDVSVYFYTIHAQFFLGSTT